ncbi:MAG: triose-phosphate isomerase [Hyphomonadaceae bacterium]|nr:triose-phosphate isomerase [Hyphomonadaceae bacterium]
MVRTLIAGNWKMNGLKSSLSEVDAVITQLGDFPDAADCLICPPATLVVPMQERAGARLKVGAQSCHPEAFGAFTGDLSAEQLKDAGASYVIVGHSERRSEHGERSAYVQEQAHACLRAGIVPIVCVGESFAQRQRGETKDTVIRILRKSLPTLGSSDSIVVAYEPLWAIGTGLVPSDEEIAEVHQVIRDLLVELYQDRGADLRILYGGSMKPSNAAEILAIKNVNGGLIGGASLKAADFMAIYAAAVA